MKLDILAFGAHPDDVELGAGGTIAREVSMGRKVGIVDLTRGELGTRGSATERDEESANASEILGIEFRANLAFRDGFFLNDEQHQLEVIKYIRFYQPEIIICNAINDRHIDHGKGSELIKDASFLSGLRKIETFWENENNEQTPWRPKAVYHYIQDRYLKSDFVVNITDFIDQKMRAVKAYKSQFYNPASEEPETVISSEKFLEFVISRSIEFGRPAGYDFAEGFTVDRISGVKSLMYLD